jgi:hypothetical protein
MTSLNRHEQSLTEEASSEWRVRLHSLGRYRLSRFTTASEKHRRRAPNSEERNPITQNERYHLSSDAVVSVLSKGCVYLVATLAAIIQQKQWQSLAPNLIFCTAMRRAHTRM